ncbi:MAG: PAS domain S-box protein [Nitrospirae bacterium]|nr:PAS domain S-box protein [Nitrospirota bacterium]
MPDKKLRQKAAQKKKDENPAARQSQPVKETQKLQKSVSQTKEKKEPFNLCEERWRYLLDTSSAWIWQTDENMRHIYTNAFVTKCLGYEPDEFLNFDILELVHPDDHVIMKGIVETATGQKKGWSNEVLRWRHKDGSWQFIETSGSPLFDSSGKFMGLHGVDHDITERRQAEIALRESESRTRSIIESIPLGMHMYRLEPDGRLIFTGANPAADRILGLDNRIFIGKPIEEAFPPLTNTDIPERYREVALSGKAWKKEDVEYEGDTIKGAFEVHAFRTANNCMVAAFEDIKHRRRNDAELREKELKYRTLFESANDGIFIYGNTGFIDCNQRGAEMYGLPKERIIGRSPGEFAPERQPDGRLSSEVADEKIRLALNGVPQVFEWQPLREDGTPFDVEITLNRLELKDSVCLQAIVRDITERKKVENALRESEGLVRSIGNNLPNGMLYQIIRSVDGTRRMSYVSEGVRKLYGCSPEEAMADPNLIYGRIAEEDRQRLWEEEEAAFASFTNFYTEAKMVNPDGRIRWSSFASSPRRLQDGSTCWDGVEIEITERKQLEEERLKSQKLESIGTLAGGIAHDFNNLLQGVFGYISMAKITFDQKDKSLAMLKQAEEALHMSVNLAAQLLTFSKGGKPVKRLIRLETAIENAARFALSGSHSDYRLEIAPDLWPVEADEGQLAQVIQNIVLNANDSMAGNGTVFIRAGNVHLQRGKNVRLPQGGRFVRIDIEDSGIGISGQTLEKIFDPYFTTKQRGSGLGLATSYSIIKNHGGLIDVKSEINRGSTFVIYLPAAAGEAHESGTASPVVRAGSRKARILLMDDEQMVRTVAREMLAALGHDVVSTEDGRKAIDLFRQEREAGRPFDLVILDLTVKGGMGGEEAIARIRDIDPNVRAVVSSGYSDNPVVADYHKYGFSAVLSKPYSIDALEDCLNMLVT